MTVTGVHLRLAPPADLPVLAYCNVVLGGCFLIHTVRLIRSRRDGRPTLSMPSRKVTAACGHCRTKNHLRARFCNGCGWELEAVPGPVTDAGREVLNMDVCHPTTAAMRAEIQGAVLAEYERVRAGATVA